MREKFSHQVTARGGRREREESAEQHYGEVYDHGWRSAADAAQHPKYALWPYRPYGRVPARDIPDSRQGCPIA